MEEKETYIGETSEITKLSMEWKIREQELLDAFYLENRETIQNAIAWKDIAAKDKTARGALYLLFSNYGKDKETKAEQIDCIVESIITWSQVTGYVFSPKTEIKTLPMILFPFQKDLIRKIVESIEYGTDLLIEKSREMGVSWTVMYVYTWYWLFRPDSNFLIGSYREKEVTDGTLDSMIGKIHFIINAQPLWVLPTGFNKRIHMQSKKVVNPMINCYITGDTMNEDFGRGARKTSIFLDELGFWDYAKGAWDACSQTTRSRIGNSTPNGYNYFKALIDSGLNKITLHWKQNPIKDDLWYRLEKLKNSPEMVAREIDISYDASRAGVVYHEWRVNRIKGNFPYDPGYPLYVGWDFGNKDGTAIIWVQVVDGRIRVIDSYYKTGRNLIDYFAPLITGNVLTEYQYDYTPEEFDMIHEHKSWKKAVHFGDPAGRNLAMGMDKSVIDTLATYGIKINYDNKKITHPARQTDTKKLILRGIEFNETKRNQWLDMSMMNYSFKTTMLDGIQQVKNGASVNHDQYSHSATAFEYLCVGLSSVKDDNKPRVMDKFSKGNPYTSIRKRGMY